ncbi:MAG: DUF4293 domain-containing protein [Bacteroidaceae bacterium]|nr:DUF4293 domain-containing protein [Bacteroidaceae bacterium]
MWQRIQTLWLVLAALLCIVCLSLPIGRFIDARGEETATLYNLWVHVPTARPAIGMPMAEAAEPVLQTEAAGSHLFTPWALFALLLIVATSLIADIFLFQHRLVQSRLAMLCCILLIAWYGVYTFFAMMLAERFMADFQLTPWAALPAMACIFSYLAFRSILKDEMLVRSLDRLR